MADDDDEFRRCPDCKGRGYHKCPCWPADCICGQDEEECETCDGTGWLDPSYDDDLDRAFPRRCETRMSVELGECEACGAAEGERCRKPRDQEDQEQ